MNKLFTKIAALVLGMTMAVGVGVAVGGGAIAREIKAEDELAYTITMNDSGTNADGTKAKTALTDLVSDGSDYISSVSTASYVYLGKSGCGLKLGSSNYAGVLKFSLSEKGQVKATKIVFEIAAANDTGKTIKLSVNGKTSGVGYTTYTTGSTAGNFDDAELSWDGSTDLTSIKVDTTAKKFRTYLKSIKVYTEKTVVDTYTVSFNGNGATGSMAPVENVSGSYTLPSNGFNVPSGKGFTGWKANNTGDLIVAGGSYQVENDVEFYAQWADVYTVTYNAGLNGTGSFADGGHLAGTYKLLSFTNLTGVSASSGYKFKDYTVGETVKNPGDTITISSDTSITVNFEEGVEPVETTIDFIFADIAAEEGWANGVAYTPVSIFPVTIEGNGGGNNAKWYTSGNGSWRMYSGGTVRISVENGEVLEVTSDPSCSFTITDGVATFSPSARTDFTKITVKYSAEPATEYTISYNSNGGSGTMESTTGTAPKVAACTFTAPNGKEFSKWNDSSDGTGTDYEVGQTVLANVTLYAIWINPVGPANEYFTQITSTTDITDGKYVIVYGELLFDGSLDALDVSSNTKAMSFDNLLDCYFTITNGKVKSASGYWIGNTSDSNAMQTSNTIEYDNTVSIDGDGNLVVLSSGGAYLRYNATSGQERFRYYKSSTYTAQKAIQLYKVNLSKIILDYVVCNPEGTSTPTGKSWSNLESYFNTLSTTDKTTLKNVSASESGSDDQKAMAKYDYIVGKYNPTYSTESNWKDFIDRKPTPIGGLRFMPIFGTTENSNMIAIVVIVSVVSLTAIGGYFFLRKKREQN